MKVKPNLSYNGLKLREILTFLIVEQTTTKLVKIERKKHLSKKRCYAGKPKEIRLGL
jgi:hypothetical protein